MHEKTLTTLDFDKVLARLARHTSFSAGRWLHPCTQPLVLSLSKDEAREYLR